MTQETITLLDDQAEFVRTQIAEGGFQDFSAVVGEGLSLLERKTQRDKKKLARFISAVEEGDKDLREGRFIDINTAQEHRDFWNNLRNEVLDAK